MSTPPVVAVIAPGGMGAPVGKRLAENGVTVLTDLSGRTADSVARAEAAGMRSASLAQIVSADLILSIIPPGEALGLAQRLAPLIEGSAARPVYVDCNAVSPQTVREIGGVIERAGAPFVDAGIVGGPPNASGYSPVFYASGDAADRLLLLRDRGLDVRVIEGEVGQASALKMCYAGLTKGLHAVGASILLGALKAGVADHLLAELADSQPELLAYFTGRTPTIFGKTYRWVAEMEEIGAFLGGPGARIYDGAARLYERLADDHAGEQLEQSALIAMLRAAKA